jgi:hypothetical protein
VGVGVLGLSRRLPHRQGHESLMDLSEKPFQGIGRAQFDVNPSNTDFEPGGHFKKAQPDLADGGMFQLSASQHQARRVLINKWAKAENQSRS